MGNGQSQRVSHSHHCCWASAGSRPYSWAIWDFSFHGSMVRSSICDCSALQSAVCLSKYLAAAPVFLLGATRNVVLLSCKICAEIVVYRMFAVFLNGLNGKNSSRSIVRNIFRFIFFILGFKISYSEYSFVTQIVISGTRIVSYISELHVSNRRWI